MIRMRRKLVAAMALLACSVVSGSAGSGAVTDRDWWAVRPVGNPEPPAAAPGDDLRQSHSEIDRFIRARLRENGLAPAPEADPAVLVRRLSFSLTGLPPQRTDVERFAADPSPEAWAALVDRLLASPQYGERLARLWLDLVRYADSDGYRADDYRPNAWRYRDYAIRAFNEDRPYDRFVQEQLAGDEMFPGDPEALVATGYLRHWIYEYNNTDAAGQWQIVLNDITDTTADVFLGIGLQCARCHDHKTDPLLQRDYFGLQAFFAPILPVDDAVIDAPAARADHDFHQREWEATTLDIRERITALETPAREKAAATEMAKIPQEIQAMIRKPAAERAPLEHQLAEFAFRQVQHAWDHAQVTGSAKAELVGLQRDLAAWDALKPPPQSLATTATDVGPVAPPVFIPKRASAGAIEPAFPTVLGGPPPEIVPGDRTTGRRTALARWITSPRNPFTARVIVNRIWQFHFGGGLCENASDLGVAGGPPTHPELLDWLARRFVDGGWSLKNLHRLILNSATWKQSSDSPCLEAGRLVDPENRLFWHRDIRRLDAEQVRDALFAASGELDLTAGGPGVAGDVPRRSVYLKLLRNSPDPLAALFDAPERFVSAPSRTATTTPLQALFLANSPFLAERAKAMAASLLNAHPDDANALVDEAWWRIAARPPGDDERADSLAFLLAPPDTGDGSDDDGRSAAVTDFCHVLLNSSALLYLE